MSQSAALRTSLASQFGPMNFQNANVSLYSPNELSASSKVAKICVGSHELFNILALCRQLPKTEAKLISCDNGNNAGSTCTAECADLGYELAGNSAVSCSTSKVKVDMEKVLLSNESNRKSFNVEVEAFEEVAQWDGNLGVCESKFPVLVQNLKF